MLNMFIAWILLICKTHEYNTAYICLVKRNVNNTLIQFFIHFAFRTTYSSITSVIKISSVLKENIFLLLQKERNVRKVLICPKKNLNL